MTRRYPLLAFLVGLIALNSTPAIYGQNLSYEDRYEAMERVYQELLDRLSLDEPTDLEENPYSFSAHSLWEELIPYIYSPIALNTANIADFYAIPLLEWLPHLRASITAILEYRRTKPFESPYDLLKVPGIGPKRFELLAPFFRVETGREQFQALYSRLPFWFDGAKTELLSYQFKILEPLEGHRSPIPRYDAGPWAAKQRIAWSSSHASWHLSLDKTVGASQTLAPKSAHFGLSDFYLQQRNKYTITLKSLIIGDIKPSSFSSRLRAYSGFSDLSSVKGWGTHVQLSKPNTPQLVELTTLQATHENNFSMTRWSLELKDFKRQRSLGLAYELENLKEPMQTSMWPSELGTSNHSKAYWQLHARTSHHQNQLSTELIYQHTSTLFAKAQWLREQSWGVLESVFYLAPDAAQAPSLRTKQRSTVGLFANGQNQKGFSLAATIDVMPKLEVRLKLDYAQRLLPGYNQKYPEHRQRLSLDSEWQPNELIAIKNVLMSQKNETSEATQKFKSSSQIQLQPTPWLRIRSRLFTHYNFRTQSRLNKPNNIAALNIKDQTTSSIGTLFYHELRIHKAVKKSHSLTIDMRWTQFNILDYDARIYTYEQDLRYAFYIPMSQGRGNQWYILSTLSIGQHLSVQFKYSVRNYPDTPSIGNGLNQTRGPVQQVIKAQVLVSW